MNAGLERLAVQNLHRDIGSAILEGSGVEHLHHVPRAELRRGSCFRVTLPVRRPGAEGVVT